jgi:Mg2+-importing ATPase
VLLLLRADRALFRTVWFVESVLSAALVIFVLRTRLPLVRSRPSRAMLAVAIAVGLVALFLPFSPIAGLLGFQAPQPSWLLIITAIVAAYLVSAEIAKRVFYRTSRF